MFYWGDKVYLFTIDVQTFCILNMKEVWQMLYR